MATLEQMIQAKKDELNALIEKQRKIENQQKIIVGSIILKACQEDGNFSQSIAKVLEEYASDRDKKKLEKTLHELKTNTRDNKKEEEQAYREELGIGIAW